LFALKELEATSSKYLYKIKQCEDYYNAWKALCSAITQYNKQLSIAGDFFSVTYHALLNSTIIELIKLYDPHKDALSLIHFLNTCTSRKDLSYAFLDYPEKHKLYKNICATFNSFISNAPAKNLITRRDKYYMHSDKKIHHYQTLITDAPLSFNDIEELISNAKTFCSTIYQLSTDNSWKPLLSIENTLEHTRDFSGLQTLLAQVVPH